ncbi:MAG: hypothetical protein J7M21_00825, partial [Planctomycetes bacterium]|nr:hypothetical protein [Planctomycetota bacterium]
FLGVEGLLGLAETIQDRRPRHFADALLEGVRDYAGGKMPPDDMTMLVLYRTAAGAPPAR